MGLEVGGVTSHYSENELAKVKREKQNLSKAAKCQDKRAISLQEVKAL